MHFMKICFWLGQGHDFLGLGSLLAALGSLLGPLGVILVSPYLHCRPWVNSAGFPSTPLFRTLTLPNFTQLNLT